MTEADSGSVWAISARQSQRIGWVLLILFAVLVYKYLHGNWSLDLTAIYFATHFFNSGQTDLIYLPGHTLYLLPAPPEYHALAAAEGFGDGNLTPYLYPPLWLAVLAPIEARISAVEFFDGGLVVNIASLIGMIWLSWKLARQTRLGFAAWSGLSVGFLVMTTPSILGLWLNQPQIFISFLTLLAFYLLAEQRDIGAGAVLALAAAIKLSPALFVLIFVMERRWRALASFLVVGGGLALASIALMGWPMHQAFLTKLADISGHIYISRIVAGLEMLLYQLGDLVSNGTYHAFTGPYDVSEPGWITWLLRLLLIAGLLASWHVTRHLEVRPRIMMRLFAVSLVGLACNPLPWIHYLFLPLLLLPGLALFWSARRVIWTWFAVALALSYPLYIWT
ncbi:MAG: glycosyltransferase family 87 protein, partial [Maritimibacter sp.]